MNIYELDTNGLTLVQAAGLIKDILVQNHNWTDLNTATRIINIKGINRNMTFRGLRPPNNIYPRLFYEETNFLVLWWASNVYGGDAFFPLNISNNGLNIRKAGAKLPANSSGYVDGIYGINLKMYVKDDVNFLIFFGNPQPPTNMFYYVTNYSSFMGFWNTTYGNLVISLLFSNIPYNYGYPFSARNIHLIVTQLDTNNNVVSRNVYYNYNSSSPENYVDENSSNFNVLRVVNSSYSFSTFSSTRFVLQPIYTYIYHPDQQKHIWVKMNGLYWMLSTSNLNNAEVIINNKTYYIFRTHITHNNIWYVHFAIEDQETTLEV